MNQSQTTSASREAAIGQATEILSSEDGDLQARLHREIILNALKLRSNGLDTLDLKILNRAMAEFSYAASVFKPYRKIRKVSIFGSARTPDSEPHYELAVEFARMLRDEEFMVITGAADGIMKAGNVGAGADKSFGVNIFLPFEQSPNEVIVDDPKLITFRYFFTRKLEAHAVALFPGGFGTHDEGFETLTLLQTGKTPPMPLVLMELPGDDYWETWDSFVKGQMLKRGLISPQDLSFYTIVHSAREGMEWITSFYSTYHSMRQVRSKLVLRLERDLTDGELRELNDLFSDIVTEGKISRTKALPVERDKPDLLSKPRIAFSYNGRSPGRLHQLVLTLNGMAGEWGE